MNGRVVLAALFTLSVPSLAADVALDDNEQAVCEAQGGCDMVTRHWLRDTIKRAFAAGHQKGLTACLKSTS